MKENKTGGPAFPAPDAADEIHGEKSRYHGMTLRDYFAAKAAPQLIDIFIPDDSETLMNSAEYIAYASYVIADAMLEAREM